MEKLKQHKFTHRFPVPGNSREWPQNDTIKTGHSVIAFARLKPHAPHVQWLSMDLQGIAKYVAA
jgi:hypothetical protein